MSPRFEEARQTYLEGLQIDPQNTALHEHLEAVTGTLYLKFRDQVDDLQIAVPEPKRRVHNDNEKKRQKLGKHETKKNLWKNSHCSTFFFCELKKIL